MYGHPRGVTFSGLGYEKVEIALFEVYERVGICLVNKKPKIGLQMHFMAVKKFWFVI